MCSAAAAKLLQSCPTLCDPIDGSPPSSHHPWDSPGKNTGVGCHFLLQCMKEKSESEVAQSCLTLSDSMICSLSGSSIHGIFQTRVLEWGATSFDFSPLLLVQDWVTLRNSYYTLSLIAVKVLSWLSQETVFKVAKFKSTNCWRQLYRDFSSMKVREVGLGRERN